jgi:hypothetical protein
MDGNTDFCKAEVSQQECTIPFANFLVLASSLYPYDPLLKPWGFLHSCTEIVMPQCGQLPFYQSALRAG